MGKRDFTVTSPLSKVTVLTLLFLLMTTMNACSKEVKRPSEESIIAKEAMEVVLEIKEAYMNKDRERLEKLLVSKEVMDNFSFFDIPREMEFIFRWVDIYDSKADVYVSWKIVPATVTSPLAGDVSTQELKGLCLFVLEGRPFKLKKILRENPFKLQP